MLKRTLLVSSILLGLSFGLAAAQEDSAGDIDMADCEAAKEAFDNYSMTKTDPDANDAKAMADQALEDCRKGETNQAGMHLLHAMGMMHDGTHTPKH